MQNKFHFIATPTTSPPFLSVVSPVYRAEAIVDKLVKEVVEQLEELTPNYEFILVEDGSPDESWAAIQTACKQNPRIKGIKLSRNFGQHYAITAGLAAAKGEWMIVMDCDLQDRPEEIPRLFAKAQAGYELVFARRVIRQDNFLKRLSSKAFYRLFSYLTDTHQDSSIANFGIYHRKAINAVLSMQDHLRYFPTMSQWIGFNRAYLDVSHGQRDSGESSYSWRSLFRLAWNNIIAFSDKPLRLTIKFGLIIALGSALIGIWYLYQYFTGQIVVIGFASLIISIWFLSGVIIFILGMIGIYLSKVFEKVKERPTYIIHQQLNFEPIPQENFHSKGAIQHV
ncbi:MAG: glycosyltransferase family 2 protein [Saprospiraceae bacterium]